MTEVDRIVREYDRRRLEVPEGRYDVTRPSTLFVRHSREAATASLLRKEGLLPLTARRILDVGCGSGQKLVDFETWGARRENLAGIDLLSQRIERAQSRLGPWVSPDGVQLGRGADIRVGNAAELPWPDGSFDLVCQSTVFSSVLDPGTRMAIAREMMRVLTVDGAILWYDFFVGNPGNPNVRRVPRRELSGLFPGFRITRRRRITLAPPLSRRIAKHARVGAILLEELRVLNTHLLAILRRD